MAKRYCSTSSQWKSMEQGPFQHEKIGVGEAQETEHASRTCGKKIGKNYMIWLKRGILVEVAHVKAHRTKKEKENRQKLKGSSLKEMRKRMSWQKQEQCWTKDVWQK